MSAILLAGMVDKVIDMIDSLTAEELQRIAEHIASKGQKA